MAAVTPDTPRYPAGQHVVCGKCGAEVEIVRPCTCEPSDMVLQCCGEAMRPGTGKGADDGGK